uniref:Uncharacterized protein n=2 Tax=Caenorhabditis tropicalis TaxID=1561998 RepID=A0A1I7U5D5_9PELO
MGGYSRTMDPIPLLPRRYPTTVTSIDYRNSSDYNMVYLQQQLDQQVKYNFDLQAQIQELTSEFAKKEEEINNLKARIFKKDQEIDILRDDKKGKEDDFTKKRRRRGLSPSQPRKQQKKREKVVEKRKPNPPESTMDYSKTLVNLFKKGAEASNSSIKKNLESKEIKEEDTS